MRFGELLAHVLRHYRKEKDLGLELQWRPLYNLMLKLFRDPVPQLQGELRCVLHMQGCKLCCLLIVLWLITSYLSCYGTLQVDIVILHKGQLLPLACHVACQKLSW